jgi:hypothetical protein
VLLASSILWRADLALAQIPQGNVSAVVDTNEIDIEAWMTQLRRRGMILLPCLDDLVDEASRLAHNARCEDSDID